MSKKTEITILNSEEEIQRNYAKLHQHLADVPLTTTIAIEVKRAIAEKLSQGAQSPYYLGTPNQKHLGMINSYLNKETDAKNWFVCCIRASDNLVNRSQERWTLKILDAMRKRSNGINLLLNHNWGDNESSVGFVFDSFLTTEISPAREAIGHESDNQKIIEKEGYHCLYCWVAIPRDIEIAKAIEDRRSQFISTGGLVNSMRLLCPVCSEAYGRDIGIYDKDDEGKWICPHSLPGWGGLDDSEETPFVVLDGDYDAIEVSFVNAPNLPAAEVLR